MEILSELVYESKEKDIYFHVENDKKKQWLFKSNTLKTGLQLYQPTAIKGILFKTIFPYIKHLTFLYKYIGVRKINIEFDDEIKDFINHIVGSSCDFSFFGGTPCEDQKVVIQISLKGEVIGYCKVAKSLKVAKLFDKKCNCLKELEKKGVGNIPKVLGRKKIGSYEIFCQTNVKSNKAKCVKTFNKVHTEFLINLFQKTLHTSIFEESNYYKNLMNFKNKVLKSSLEYKDLLIYSINLISEKYIHTEFNFGFYHGDFTPWNTAIDEDELKVFDFEYSKESYPPYLDAFHFFLQTEFFVKKVEDIEDILNDYKKFKNKICCFNIDLDMYFIMYLLEIINLYYSRTEIEDEIDIKHNRVRIKLLRRLLEEYDNRKNN